MHELGLLHNRNVTKRVFFIPHLILYNTCTCVYVCGCALYWCSCVG